MSDPISVYVALEMTISNARKARAAIKQLSYLRGRTRLSADATEPQALEYLEGTLKSLSEDIFNDAIKRAKDDALQADAAIMNLAEQLRTQDPLDTIAPL